MKPINPYELPVYEPKLVIPKPARWQWVGVAGMVAVTVGCAVFADSLAFDVDYVRLAVTVALGVLFAAAVVGLGLYGAWTAERLVPAEDYDEVRDAASEFLADALDQRERAIKAERDRDRAQAAVEDAAACEGCPLLEREAS